MTCRVKTNTITVSTGTASMQYETAGCIAPLKLAVEENEPCCSSSIAFVHWNPYVP
uniref:Uncharacterized protein n=1 Tax=Anguilla anguilla TaxID=7936 RepID=A0A0E9PSB4_ANGAN